MEEVVICIYAAVATSLYMNKLAVAISSKEIEILIVRLNCEDKDVLGAFCKQFAINECRCFVLSTQIFTFKKFAMFLSNDPHGKNYFNV